MGWQTPKQIPNKTAVGTHRRPNSSKQVEVDKPKGKPKVQSNGKAKREAQRQASRGAPRCKLYNAQFQSETQFRNDNRPKQPTQSDESQKKNGTFKTKRTKQTEKVEARKKKKVLTKKEFGNIVATLRTISMTILVEFIQNFIKSERHLTAFH